MSAEPVPVLDAALDYLRRGFSVIPLRGCGDAENRKRPAVDGWKQFQEIAPSEEQVRAWWTEDPNRGVAILTGSVSRLVVVDLDGPRAGELVRERASLPRTAAVKTGKGFHGYYRAFGSDIRNRAELLKDGAGSQVDVRGEGGYVVAPPTVHGSGRIYQWVVPLEELAPLPPDLEELLVGGDTPPTRADDGPSWWPSLSEGVDKGGRNAAAARVAGYFARVTGGDAEATTRAVGLWNMHNRPPLSEAELTTVVRSVAKREDLRRRAEVAQKRGRLEVIDGPTLAAELENSEPRRGLEVGMPGLAAVDGLVEGDLVTLAGRPGMGKSSYGAHLTWRACLQHHVPTLVISTEMSRREWGQWSAAAAWDIPAQQLVRPWPAELLSLFRHAPLSIVDAGAPTIQDIRAVAESTLGLRLLIVDHIGKISGGRKETRTLEVGDVARALKALARDLRCTVLALCQLNRDIENRENKRPRLVDLRESGEIEQESDVVMFLYSPAGFDPKAETRGLTLALEKFRHGQLRDQAVTLKAAAHRFELRQAPGGAL